MSEEDDYSDIEDLSQIRAEQDYFKKLCFFHQTKIASLITANVIAGRGMEHYELYAIEAAIRNFETDLEGLLDKDYYKERNKTVHALKKLSIESKQTRKQYLELLLDWKKQLIRRLARRTDYLPSIHASLMIDNGFLVEEKDEPYEQEEGLDMPPSEAELNESHIDEDIQPGTSEE